MTDVTNITAILDALVPPLSPDRAKALDPLRERTIKARAGFSVLADEQGDTAERAAQIQLGPLKSKMTPTVYNVVGVLRSAAVELLSLLDRAELPIDIRSGFRTCVAAKTDGEFSAALTALARDVGRSEGGLSAARMIAAKMLDNLDALTDVPLFAAEFQLQPETVVTFK